MSDTEDKILKFRQYWIDKIDKQVTAIQLASLDGDNRQHESLQDDLETSFICLWRIDRRLMEHRIDDELWQ